MIRTASITSLLVCAVSTAEAGSRHSMDGVASVYAYRAGKTASGERVASGAMTAAHRSLPFGTKVRVTNKRSGKSVVVRINDRGPFIRGRVIDLTPAAARALGFSGLARVELAVVNYAESQEVLRCDIHDNGVWRKPYFLLQPYRECRSCFASMFCSQDQRSRQIVRDPAARSQGSHER